MPYTILTGLTETLPDNLILDCGELIRGINLTSMRSGLTTSYASAVTTTWTDWQSRSIVPRKLGTTRGDTKFMVGMNMTQVKANGLRIPMVGLDRVRHIAPTLSTALLEASSYQQLADILVASDVSSWGGTYDEFNQRLILEETDYLPNIAIAATRQGSPDQPVVIVLDNPISEKDPNFDFKDQDEVAVGVTFSARGLLNAPTTVPCHYFVSTITPNPFGSGS